MSDSLYRQKKTLNINSIGKRNSFSGTAIDSLLDFLLEHIFEKKLLY
jgi:hypothetical protein